MADPRRVALVTGGNRGIGLEMCRHLAQRGMRVILGSRDPKKGEEAAEALRKKDLDITVLALDVSWSESIHKAVSSVKEKFFRVDVLVNNAGIFLDPHEKPGVFDADPAAALETFVTNVMGPLHLCQALIPLMKAHKYGRVVNLSSGLAQLSEMRGDYPGYRMSKVALNALTVVLASELRGTNVLVNAVDPGWVKTDMGGPRALISVEEGVDTPLWLATLPDDGPTGGFFRERKIIPW